MDYISKEEKRIPIEDPSGKWSDLTLLPEWEEPYYDVYTVKKFGKWVMLKALKKQYAENPKFREMLEKEFETRYNLAHPNIVMVNDFEDIPGVGMSIVTDDVYGYSLRRLIDEKRLTPRIVHRLRTQLLDALAYIEENHVVHHPITPDSIIFTEYNENLKLINVGYDQTSSLSEQGTRADIEAYGRVLAEVLDNLPENIPHLRKVSDKCLGKGRPYDNVMALQLDMERRSPMYIYIFLSLLVAILLLLVVWLIK